MIQKIFHKILQGHSCFRTLFHMTNSNTTLLITINLKDKYRYWIPMMFFKILLNTALCCQNFNSHFTGLSANYYFLSLISKMERGLHRFARWQWTENIASHCNKTHKTATYTCMHDPTTLLHIWPV